MTKTEIVTRLVAGMLANDYQFPKARGVEIATDIADEIIKQTRTKPKT